MAIIAEIGMSDVDSNSRMMANRASGRCPPVKHVMLPLTNHLCIITMLTNAATADQ